ncbi:MAG: hypothetical protein CMJ50_09795 [Planctomycetaceae bacterium]|nr:hypothetical protein [Planctomycetaceae bacterium]
MYRIAFWLVLPALWLGHTCNTRAEQKSATSIQFVSSRKAVNYKWVNVTQKAAYAPRDGAGALVFNGKM